MARRMAKILAAAIALGFGLETSFAPGAMPGVMSEAFAFGHGGFGGGGHFGGGHFGGFGGGHFGGFRGGHFGGMHFGGYFCRHFGGGHFARSHFGGRQFGGSHFGGGRFGHANLAGQRFGGAGSLGGRSAFAHNGFGGRGIWPIPRRPRLRRPRVQSQRLRQHGRMECLGQQLLGCRLERLGERMGLLGRPGFLALLFRRCADVRALALCLLRPILRVRARLVADQHLLARALVLALLRLQSLLLWGKRSV